MAPHSPHQREKSQHAQVESSVRAELDLENRNYVIIDKGRNVTIVKSQTENNPPRTVANTKFTDEEVRGGKQLIETQKWGFETHREGTLRRHKEEKFGKF